MTEPGQGPPEDLAQPAPAGAVEVVTGLSKAYRWRLAAVGFVVAFVLILLWGANRPANPTFADASNTGTTAAQGPTFGEKKIGVGSSCLRVQVADTPEKRAYGLRNRSDDHGFDGMLFEFGQTMNHDKTRFTMSEVKFPLTIGFYNESGLRVDATDMAPCAGSDSTCPSYGSKANFNSAIETPKGKLPDGPLTACPGS
ncbi:MAG: uncharacterized protein QOD57_494 [Actinomycetota bacterium]|jgi:uncharacterized membrane protein (UPF0127 family)|nr:uncharacterized protein [Actinomycetota bacterium]